MFQQDCFSLHGLSSRIVSGGPGAGLFQLACGEVGGPGAGLFQLAQPGRLLAPKRCQLVSGHILSYANNSCVGMTMSSERLSVASSFKTVCMCLTSHRTVVRMECQALAWSIVAFLGITWTALTELRLDLLVIIDFE